MQIYYESADEINRINFDGKIFGIENMDVFKSEFAYIEENGRVIEFENGIFTYELEINVSDYGTKNWKESYAEMISIFDKDVIENMRGRLYVNGYYLLCNVYGREHDDVFREWCDFQNVRLKIVSDAKRWIKESENKFYSFETSSNSNKRYPDRYPYRYANGEDNAFVINPHFYESNFRIIIYGPVINPQITIGGHTYLVNIVLESGEYLEIDSESETLKKYFVNGISVNAFHNRKKGGIFFQKIQPGKQYVMWTGKFSFDLTLYEERSEPKW